MPSPEPAPGVPRGSVRTLVRKELRELAVSPSLALMLVFAGLLVGHEFMSSVATYSQLSASGAMVARGMNPLDGILVPTFGAYDLVAMLLLPFVVIRVFSHERTTGAWTILLQAPSSVDQMISAKMLALLVAWIVALIPGFAAVALWIACGGHVFAPELWLLLYGYLLRALLTVAVAALAAAVTKQAATAAIVTLGFTIGTWALDFAAATRGGVWMQIAAFTPTAALRTFEQGLLRLDTTFVTLVVAAACMMVAAGWLASGIAMKWRWLAVTRALLILSIGTAVLTRIHASVDVTEDRRHSFSEADEAALRRLPAALRIEIHLGADDPRLTDLRHEILDRLERVVPHLTVSYEASAGTGVLGSADPHYGEIWYEIAGKRIMLKSAIEPVVLQTIYDLAGVKATPAVDSEAYPGYPLTTIAQLTWLPFFIIWPAIVLTLFWRSRKA